MKSNKEIKNISTESKIPNKITLDEWLENKLKVFKRIR